MARRRKHQRSKVRHIHLSGRFDASDDEFRAALTVLITMCDVLTLTEVASERFEEIIKEVTMKLGWWTYHPDDEPGQAECAVLWDPSLLQAGDRDVHRLTELRLRYGRTVPIWALFVQFWLKGSPDREFWLSFSHLPAHVEGPKGYQKGWPAKVHKACVRGWKRHLRDLGAWPRILFADWNLNLRRRWVQTWLANQFPRLEDTFLGPLTGYKRGTHHRRIIDFGMTSLRVGDTKVLETMPGFDHAAVFTIYWV